MSLSVVNKDLVLKLYAKDLIGVLYRLKKKIKEGPIRQRGNTFSKYGRACLENVMSGAQADMWSGPEGS